MIELNKENFNLSKTAIYESVKFERNPLLRYASFFKKLSFYFLIISILFFILIKIGLLNFIDSSFILGTIFISISSFLFFWQFNIFFNNKVRFPKMRKKIFGIIEEGDYNLAGALEFKVAKSLHQAFKKTGRKKLNTSDFVFFVFKNNPEFVFIFNRLEINFNDLKKNISKLKFSYDNELVYPFDFQKIINDALKEALTRNATRIGSRDILVSLLDNYDPLKKIFSNKNIKKEDVRSLAEWLYALKYNEKYRKKFWEWKNLAKKGTLARDWASGYSLYLDRFSIDWTKKLSKGFPEIIGHEEKVNSMERGLSREDLNNVLLVGESGVGKKSMIFELARKSFFGESLPGVNYKRIVELDIPGLLARIDNSGEIEKIIDTIFQEVTFSGNIILVIDAIHNFIGGESAPGKINISGILGSYLPLANFKIVGITNYGGYRKVIEESSLSSFFEKVEVPELSKNDTFRVLQRMTLGLEKKHNIMVSYLSLKQIIDYCSKYMPSRPFPKKAMDLLDEAIVYISQNKGKILLPEHIADIVSQKTNIPIGDLKSREKNILMNLENLIHEKVINQEEAIKEVSSALRRSRAEISIRKKPMGTFLFLGPTGVGKTETAKALAEVYFNSIEKMIRIDMSEFQNLSDIARLIGSSEYEGILTTKVKENPFSLILLDEIEKAHKDILNIFLQILDEGHVTDGLGRKIDFKNSIIIATSNAGSNIIINNIKKGYDLDKFKGQLLGHLFEEGLFRPEFINRFDAVVLFTPLTPNNLIKIVELILKNVADGLKDKNIEIIITEELKRKIVDLGYNPIFGAREIKRVIQSKVENILASAIISGRIKNGDKIKINSETFEIEIL